MADKAVSLSRNSTTIKTYKLDYEWVLIMMGTKLANSTDFPKIYRAGRSIENVKVPTAWETPCIEESTSIHARRGLGPILSLLPGEIRNVIYSYLFATGHLQFLRASKALYVEGSSLISEHGIYRMGFGSDRINYSLPSQRVVDTIRNLDICIDLGMFGGYFWAFEGRPDLWLFEAFGEPGFVRGQCDVSLEVYPSTTAWWAKSLCTHLQLLSDFETVIVQVKIMGVEPGPTATYPTYSMMSEVQTAWFEHRETDTVSWSVFKCQHLYRLLRLPWNFGKECLEEQDERGFRLTFHPRKALEKSENGE